MAVLVHPADVAGAEQTIGVDGVGRRIWVKAPCNSKSRPSTEASAKNVLTGRTKAHSAPSISMAGQHRDSHRVIAGILIRRSTDVGADRSDVLAAATTTAVHRLSAHSNSRRQSALKRGASEYRNRGTDHR